MRVPYILLRRPLTSGWREVAAYPGPSSPRFVGLSCPKPRSVAASVPSPRTRAAGRGQVERSARSTTCPVEEEQLYIDPDECIDRDACVEARPVDATTSEDLVPPDWEHYIEPKAANYRTGGDEALPVLHIPTLGSAGARVQNAICGIDSEHQPNQREGAGSSTIGYAAALTGRRAERR